MFTTGSLSYHLDGGDYTTPIRAGAQAEFPHGSVAFDATPVPLGTRIDIAINPETPFTIKKLHIETNYPFTPSMRVFCNGFQSWTESREFLPNEKLKPMWRILKGLSLPKMGDYELFPYSGKKGRLHGYTYSYLRHAEGRITLIGSLSEAGGYTVITHDTTGKTITIAKDCRGHQCDSPYTDFRIVVMEGPEDEVFDEYRKLTGAASRNTAYATGWTSWYNHFMDITEDIAVKNLEAFGKHGIPIDIFQIDGGWYSHLGDWLSVNASSFPSGMKNIADRVKRLGFTPGLWLGPFVCEKESDLFTKHPEFLLRDESGRPVAVSWQPTWFKGSAECDKMYAMDIYNAAFQDYMKRVFDTVVREWGFEMLKLDFLYAAAVLPRAGKSRGAVMHDGMKMLREWAGNTVILGCGVPLGSSFGMVDYCRIGSDVAIKWEDPLTKLINNRERPSTINSLNSTIGRRHLNDRFFINDPDVFLMRSENNLMNANQKFTLLLLNNILGGLVFTSDDIDAYSGAEMAVYRAMFPLRKKKIAAVSDDNGLNTIRFSIGSLEYTSFSNLTGKARTVKPPEGYCYHADPWTGDERFTAGAPAALGPFESRCCLMTGGDFTVAGSTGHIFPGSEISSINMSGTNITVIREPKACRTGIVSIRVPGAGEYRVNGLTARGVQVLDGLYIVKTEI